MSKYHPQIYGHVSTDCRSSFRGKQSLQLQRIKQNWKFIPSSTNQRRNERQKNLEESKLFLTHRDCRFSLTVNTVTLSKTAMNIKKNQRNPKKTQQQQTQKNDQTWDIRKWLSHKSTGNLFRGMHGRYRTIAELNWTSTNSFPVQRARL